MSPAVGELVEHIWQEAMGELESIISVPVTSVKPEQVGYYLESETVSPPVGDLVEHIWQEAMGELESIISVPVTSVKPEQVSYNLESETVSPAVRGYGVTTFYRNC